MSKKLSLLLLTALVPGLLAVSLPQTAEARPYYRGRGAPPPPNQRPNPLAFKHRFHFYVGLQGSALVVVDQSSGAGAAGPGEFLGHGGGGGLFAGLRMGRWFALELNWAMTYHNFYEEYDAYWDYYEWSALHLQTMTLDGKLHIPTWGIVEPFVQAGVGFSFAGVSFGDDYSQEDYNYASGVAFNVGGGLDIWLGPFITLGGRILYRGMAFGEPSIDARGRTTYRNYVSGVALDANVAAHF